MRVGFLFNHDQIHQVAHSLPIALALARARPDVEVVVAMTNDALSNEVQRLSAGSDLPSVRYERLSISSAARKAGARVLGGVVPAAKLLVYGDNLSFFRSLDALVVTERTSLVLKTRYGLSGLRMFLADHGAGDRAIGFGKSTALFDHILAAGPKIRDRLVDEAGVAPERVTITGYSKFDIAPECGRLMPLQSNGRPTILYNPHLSPHLSSWYKWGRAVLDWFLEQDRYNLIFAPHVMLFQRRVVLTIDKFRMDFPGGLHRRYLDAPHIHVDKGSTASTDMTYTNCADVYLGDASSQVYEFLRTPRPCVFLNPFGFAHEHDPNFAHWGAGPVVNSLDRLGEALDLAVEEHANVYKPRQHALLARTFDVSRTPASARAAAAIIRSLDLSDMALASDPELAFA
ncbi:hypothetical protein [Aquisediminimonas profunda]|uniref:hypothetical protein n=1 Tax=Aquisediminimonas profunda TaxID=1550733 RepID=UPI001C62ABBD|nr:hypothetical protein [Aquisediminimonas profunda]